MTGHTHQDTAAPASTYQRARAASSRLLRRAANTETWTARTRITVAQHATGTPLLVGFVLLVLAAEPAMAGQSVEKVFCNSTLSTLVGGLLSLFTLGAAVGGVLVYKWTAVSQIFARDPKQMEQLKQTESRIKSVVLKAISAEGVYLIIAAATPLPGLGCVLSGVGL